MVCASDNAIGNEGGSIKIGATGKVSALMMKELESIKSSKKSVSSKRRIQTAPVSISCGYSTKRLQQKTTSSNDLNTTNNHRRPGSTQRKKKNGRQTSNIPMLGSEDILIDRTSGRNKPEKKALQIVEMVDLKCGNPDGDWSGSIGNQLRRLSFSKLSD